MAETVSGKFVQEYFHYLAYLATDPALSGVTGSYFNGREPAQSSDESRDLDKAEDLWQASIRLTRLQPHESLLLRQEQEEPGE